MDLPFLDNCFMEAMRLDAPFRLSGINVAHEDFEIKYYNKGEKRRVLIPKGTRIQLNIDALCKNSEQWAEPNRYEPMRFAPNHPLFNKPDGAERNGRSWSPFGAGQR